MLALSGGYAQNVFATESEGQYLELYVSVSETAEDNDELFAEYFESILYEDIDDDEESSADDGIATVADYGTSYFPDGSAAYSLYSQLKTAAAQIAASGGSTIITFSSYPSFTYTNSNGDDADTFYADALAQFQEDVGEVIDCLLADCPSELYWYDKTSSTPYAVATVTGTDSYTFKIAYIKMPVAESYQGSDDDGNASKYVVDPDIAGAAAAVVASAAQVVSEYASLSDYEKLAAYKDWICDSVSYNYDAASSDYTDGYGDPWQIIYVFDEDSTTNVVCEGYSKAFQYLCDLSTFASSTVNCYTVTGTLGSEGHMWNIVRMEDGESYLADITNSDSGTIGSSGGLFLVGNSDGSAQAGYTFTLSKSVVYTYDDSSLSLYGSDILTLAESNYVYESTDDASGEDDTTGSEDSTDGDDTTGGDDATDGDDTTGNDDSTDGDDTTGAMVQQMETIRPAATVQQMETIRPAAMIQRMETIRQAVMT